MSDESRTANPPSHLWPPIIWEAVELRSLIAWADGIAELSRHVPNEQAVNAMRVRLAELEEQIAALTVT